MTIVCVRHIKYDIIVYYKDIVPSISYYINIKDTFYIYTNYVCIIIIYMQANDLSH